MEPLTGQARVQVSADVLFSQVGDEAVLLNLKSGVYYSLDPVGTLVWTKIARGERLGDVQKALFEQFTVDSDVIWADLATLVTDLTAKGLITILQVEE